MINATKSGVLLLLIISRLDVPVSYASIADATIDSKNSHLVDGIVPLLSNQRATIDTNVLLHDSTMSMKSRGLGVGESTKKVSNKKDSMGKLVNKEEDEDEILQDKTKEKSMKKSKSYNGKGGKNSGKKMKAPSTFPVKAPVAPDFVVSDTPSIAPIVAPAVTSPPSVGVVTESSSPTLAQHIVRLEDYYMSFVAPDASRSPTTEEYAEMLLRITAYFDAYLTEYLATNQTLSFDRIETSNDFNLYGTPEAGQPEERYNIFMNFNYSDFIFSPDTLNPPTSDEIFAILLTSITADLILDVVRTYTFAPFESTNEIFCGSSPYIDGPP